MWRWVLLISLALLPSINANSVDNYYCHEDNCYELLGIGREATKNDIKRAFRSRASKTHPDKFQDPVEKAEAEQLYIKLATARDILSDDEVRADYDYMLDHPDEFYMNYYRAWRRRNYPNVDVRIVIAVTISVISGIQYYHGWNKYNEAISHFAATPKYRNKAMEMAKEQGIWTPTDKKKMRGVSKQQQREDEEKIIRKVVEENMDIRGVYAKPTYYDLLWVQLFMLPVWSYQLAAWHVKWLYKFTLMKQPYEEEHKLYIIRRSMKLTQGQFDALEDHERLGFLKEELWKAENFTRWKAAKDEETRVKLASNTKLKMYRRYLKQNGPGRMYFDDS